jgi:hypothetical protein
MLLNIGCAEEKNLYLFEPNLLKNMLQLTEPVKDRNTSLKDTDRSALHAIVQAAVNVELFTIPLYMASLYSLQGTHQINGQNDFYLGRRWPGMSTSSDPKSGNEKAFNGIFSVFIAEMLHLQLASNICKAVGAVPNYTSKPLQDENYGWICYGPDKTVIPHIIDLKDTKSPHNEVKVNIGPVNKNQLALFLAIEETEEDAEKIIDDQYKDKYKINVPFDNWTIKSKPADLPMFGSIGNMYLSLFKYLSITYTDNTTLWDYVYKPNSLQQDVFNANTPPSHYPEYPDMRGTIDVKKEEEEDKVLAKDKALLQVIDMIQGITDQGEGKGVIPIIKQAALRLLKSKSSLMLLNAKPVEQNFQPNADALEKDYPSYNDKGEQLPKSKDATARVHYGAINHFDTFTEVQGIFDKGDIYTWEQWHAEGNSWTAEMLQTPDYSQNKYPLPAADDIAGALNRLKETDGDNNHKMFSQVVAGAIKGVTSVLNDYWNGKTKTFPFPSMSGSGDRMSICWAIFGKAPDLSLGIEAKTPGILYHACQGLNLDPNNPGEPNNCAAVEVFHTCKGSNTCAAEGGCGFVQNVNGGGSCGGSGSSCGGSGQPASSCNTSGNPSNGCGSPVKPAHGCGKPGGDPAHGCGNKRIMLAQTSNGKAGCGQPSSCGTPNPVLCGTPTPAATGPVYYSAPSDNRCQSFGGCAVPISASQMFPAADAKNPDKGGQMALYNFLGTQFTPTPINTMAYNTGDLVYDTAWNAYIAVLQSRNRPIPAKPKPSDLRLAFPPST